MNALNRLIDRHRELFDVYREPSSDELDAAYPEYAWAVTAILDTDTLTRTLREHDVQAVLHFAARCYVGESMEQPDLYWRINRDGTTPKDNPWLGRATVPRELYAHGFRDPDMYPQTMPESA